MSKLKNKQITLNYLKNNDKYVIKTFGKASKKNKSDLFNF